MIDEVMFWVGFFNSSAFDIPGSIGVAFDQDSEQHQRGSLQDKLTIWQSSASSPSLNSWNQGKGGRKGMYPKLYKHHIAQSAMTMWMQDIVGQELSRIPIW